MKQKIRHLMGLGLKIRLKRTIILTILVLTFCSTVFSSVAVGQEDSENNQPVSEEGFFDRLITYIKKTCSQEKENCRAQEKFPKSALQTFSSQQILRQQF